MVIWYDVLKSSRRRTSSSIVLAAPADAEHAAEQHRVGDERQHVERQRDQHPVPGRVADPVEHLALDPDHLREHVVDRDHHQADREQQADHPPLGQELPAALLEVVVVGHDLLGLELAGVERGVESRPLAFALGYQVTRVARHHEPPAGSRFLRPSSSDANSGATAGMPWRTASARPSPTRRSST